MSVQTTKTPSEKRPAYMAALRDAADAGRFQLASTTGVRS